MSKFQIFVLSTIQNNTQYNYGNYPLTPESRQQLSSAPRKILVLDLDDTLIHTDHDARVRPTVRSLTPPDFSFQIPSRRHRCSVTYFAYKRPHVDYFLDIVSQWYELVVFTASDEMYGSQVADNLDNGRDILRKRFYRQHCTINEHGYYTKNLSRVCSDLRRIFILDNSPDVYRDFPDNAIPIKSWYSNPRDVALLDLLPVLDALRFCRDIRSVLSSNLHLHGRW